MAPLCPADTQVAHLECGSVSLFKLPPDSDASADDAPPLPLRACIVSDDPAIVQFIQLYGCAAAVSLFMQDVVKLAKVNSATCAAFFSNTSSHASPTAAAAHATAAVHATADEPSDSGAELDDDSAEVLAFDQIAAATTALALDADAGAALLTVDADAGTTLPAPIQHGTSDINSKTIDPESLKKFLCTRCNKKQCTTPSGLTRHLLTCMKKTPSHDIPDDAAVTPATS